MPVKPLPRRGFTLVELIVVVVVAAVTLGAVGLLLASNQRFYRSESQILDVEEGLRAVAQLVPAELRELSAADGDIIAMGRDSITLRAMRGLAFICRTPSAGAGTVVVADSLTFAWRAVDPTRDRALVFREGDPSTGDDDRWLEFGIAGVGGATCDDSSSGTTLRLMGPVWDLDSVSAGSPVRTYERVTYRLYADDQGLSWLGERGYSDGGWSALSPVAGPLRRVGGLSFDYYDSAGALTAEPARVVRIGVTARGLSAGPIAEPGRTSTGRAYEDSVAVQAALRND